ncbi:MAG TPA: adenylate/guanylate cyclase domain-containing protein [Kofleriaceae bacterium]
MRLRPKITTAFFIVSATVSLLLAVFMYRFVEARLREDLAQRLADITHVGAHSLDGPEYRELVGKLGELDDGQTADVEHSPAFKRVYDQLRAIRAAEPKLIRFAYILAPTADPTKPRFVGDADVLDLLAQVAAGSAPADTEISHFAQEYELKDVPLLQKALTDCSTELEPDFVYDDAFKLYSISAYQALAGPDGQPLRRADGKCLGVLGIDIADTEVRATLAQAGRLAIEISVGAALLSLIISIAMGTVITRSILALSATVKRFAEKDFTARTKVLGKDEIGQLGENFNAMAGQIEDYSVNLEDTVRRRTAELSAEKATSERLLLNVLPAPIAERLKHGENLIVDKFDAVTVLFADIVGFTALSSRTTPEKLVTMLNELFTTFDKLAEKHGLEKIKTIGDAYMVVAGIPRPIADHALAMINFAIDMLASIQAYSDRTSSGLTIRVGVHTGSVVAGVIGEKKFIYDLWGDTVNTASRMESHGIAGRVHVSEATYEQVRDHFDLESRGVIEVKGKGEMTTYLVVGPRAAAERPGALS